MGWMQGAKAIRKDAVKMVETTVQLGGDITKGKRRNANQALKEAYEELKEMYGEREYHFMMIPMNGTTPHLHCDFCAGDKRESIGERRDRRQKKMRRTQKFLENNARKGASLNLHDLERSTI